MVAVRIYPITAIHLIRLMCLQLGAVLILTSTDILLTNCTFNDNFCDTVGGAMTIDQSDFITISDSSFDMNEAYSEGGCYKIFKYLSNHTSIGGIYLHGRSSTNSTYILNCDFR